MHKKKCFCIMKRDRASAGRPAEALLLARVCSSEEEVDKFMVNVGTPTDFIVVEGLQYFF